jgi:hypothetical protein
VTQVRLLVAIAGVDFSLSAGELYACDDASAQRMIAAGTAEAIVVEVEAAVIAPPETAMRPKAARRTASRG